MAAAWAEFMAAGGYTNADNPADPYVTALCYFNALRALGGVGLEQLFLDGAGDLVDVALATNMISVGLDITRLGLMMVQGQPKAAAEYIQATSRVGRDQRKPGLVITALNLHKPRDRGHHESFTTFHESFYRAVDATSVTPWQRGPWIARSPLWSSPLPDTYGLNWPPSVRRARSETCRNWPMR
jgi:hypothetical protein